MTEPTTAADVIDWPRSWDADAIAWVKRQIIGEYLREAEARQQDASALRTALERLLAIVVVDDGWDLGPNGGEIAGAIVQARATLAALPEPKR